MSTATAEPEAFFYCEIADGDKNEICKHCLRNWRNSGYAKDEIHNWHNPQHPHQYACDGYLRKVSLSKKQIDLLVKDMCSRLPYGVLCNKDCTEDIFLNKNFCHTLTSYDCNGHCFILDDCYGGRHRAGVGEFMPLLRPMARMTNEEFDTLQSTIDAATNPQAELGNGVEWFDKRMLDHRGLIKAGVAFEAPVGLYFGDDEKTDEPLKNDKSFSCGNNECPIRHDWGCGLREDDECLLLVSKCK